MNLESLNAVRPQYQHDYEYCNEHRKQQEQAALALIEAEFGPDHVETAEALLATTFGLPDSRDAGEVQRHRAVHERAIAIFKNAFGPDYERLAWLHNFTGRVCHIQEDYHGALDHYLEALRITEVNHGAVSMQTAVAFTSLREFWHKGSRPQRLVDVLLVRNCPMKEEIVSISSMTATPSSSW